ncbi:MAG: hypothetical protein K940chlam4_00681 [Candidatus Anoxychlamydiales bacterium]|nr:hypothetical protein [Candidatus Anoxychlamydiales bacterium]
MLIFNLMPISLMDKRKAFNSLILGASFLYRGIECSILILILIGMSDKVRIGCDRVRLV